MSRRGWLVAGIAAAAVVLAVVVAVRWVPAVPAGAASVAVARTALAASTPAGSECLPRIERDAGYLDVCWHAERERADEDPTKDYYRLNVFGTFGAGSSGSPRWARLVADLDGEPADNVLQAWPAGTYDGPCTEQPVDVGPISRGETGAICGHLEATEPAAWASAITWTCRGCLIPDDADRAIDLYVMVGMPEGTIPTWDIYADVGG